MYIPTHFQQPNPKEVQALILQNPLGILINNNRQNLTANHLPFHLSPGEKSLGVLRTHVARANPLWQTLNADQSVLVIFQGPNAYITPSWYPSKRVDQKVVPTWNYVAVHVSATVKVTQDEESLHRHLNHLVDHNEGNFSSPWKVNDAPEEFISRMIKHIVGIELAVTQIESKWKISQNQSTDNFGGVVAGLKSVTNDETMAQLMEHKLPKDS